MKIVQSKWEALGLGYSVPYEGILYAWTGSSDKCGEAPSSWFALERLQILAHSLTHWLTFAKLTDNLKKHKYNNGSPCILFCFKEMIILRC